MVEGYPSRIMGKEPHGFLLHPALHHVVQTDGSSFWNSLRRPFAVQLVQTFISTIF